MRRLLREIDIPPLWLIVFGLAGWGLVRLWALPVPLLRPVGLALMAAGIGLMLAAVAQMAWHRTTAIPRRAPRQLVTGGLFALSRNPIYLGDAIALTGWLLWIDGVWTLPLVPAFMAFLLQRYIRAEEAVLAAAFPQEFAAWRLRTRRWL
ncbi:methyltransferase family protein [Paenirhodobacter sp.]|jgi:protein-S-isoprenylcysteine O-methyltransferase Ste14|uniref:methyltransferase family protein n=1 Tax=Paenirhodobacter sp. TaxID=1965326 RepID=UPI003B50379E